MSLFHDLRRSIDTMGRLQEKFDARYEPAPTTDKGVKLTDGSVAVGGHAYHLGGAWGLDIANGEEIDVRNAGRPAAADYHFNSVRRLRDKLPYQNVAGLMVVEEDGDPAVFGVTQIVVTSGTLTDNKGGSISIDTGGGGGGGQHIARLMLPLPATTYVPGPYNLCLDNSDVGIDLTFKAIRIESDGQIAGDVAGQSFSFAAGGSNTGIVDLAGTWTYGTAIAYNITSQGSDGTYLIADLLATE